jgi:hypothetical protein
MLTLLTVLTAGMVMTLVLVMARTDAPPAPAPTRAQKPGARDRSTR